MNLLSSNLLKFELIVVRLTYYSVIASLTKYVVFKSADIVEVGPLKVYLLDLFRSSIGMSKFFGLIGLII